MQELRRNHGRKYSFWGKYGKQGYGNRGKHRGNGEVFVFLSKLKGKGDCESEEISMMGC